MAASPLRAAPQTMLAVAQLARNERRIAWGPHAPGRAARVRRCGPALRA